MVIHPERDPIEDEAERILDDQPELRKDLNDFGRAYDSGQVPAGTLVPHNKVRKRLRTQGVELPPDVR
ncbi:MAG: hypothetical protein ACR2GX_04850 [Candidatus Dormibacteria bacterium]